MVVVVTDPQLVYWSLYLCSSLLCFSVPKVNVSVKEQVFGCLVFHWIVISDTVSGSEMERDFMGLSSKEPLAVDKEEINDESGMFVSYS
ncbi:hypothetical protein Lal_00016126 [Lupinus albus]|nr:hypothetical protein Lal_00016126 [Lupinus albus]